MANNVRARHAGPLPPQEGLKAAKNLVRLVGAHLENQTITLPNIEADFPQGVVRFTPEEYIRFALESIDAAMKSTRTNGDR